MDDLCAGTKLKTVLFDFDGVLAESLEVKTRAFYDLYDPFGEDIAEAVKEHHLANGGVSRFEKFRIYHRDYLDQELSNEEVEQWAAKFSELVLQGVVASAEVAGASELLEQLKGKVHMAIITGTPTEEMVEILELKGWTDYFDRVMGSPKKKTEWVAELKEENYFESETTVLIGDATSDFEAAQSQGIPFFLREHKDNVKLFEEHIGPKGQDLHDFMAFLNSSFI